MKRKMLVCGISVCMLLGGCGNAKGATINDRELIIENAEFVIKTEETDSEVATEQVTDTEKEKQIRITPILPVENRK